MRVWKLAVALAAVALTALAVAAPVGAAEEGSESNAVLKIGWAHDPATLNPFVGLDEENYDDPSRMASVSRLGLATEPQSRWSRPMTMGAVNSPVRTISLKARAARWR